MLSIFLFLVIFSIYIWLSYNPSRTSNQQQLSYNPATATTNPTTVTIHDTPTTPTDAQQPDGDNKIQIIENRTPISEQPASIAKQLKTNIESVTESKPELIRPNQPAPELVEAARESASATAEIDAAQIPIEELAPEVELAPSAEAPPSELPPTIPVEVEPTNAPAAELRTATSKDSVEEPPPIEPVLTEEEAIALAVETTLAEGTTPEASSDEQEDSDSHLVRPNPPDPELVEAAIRDAVEKSEDFSPPENVDNEEVPA